MRRVLIAAALLVASSSFARAQEGCDQTSTETVAAGPYSPAGPVTECNACAICRLTADISDQTPAERELRLLGVASRCIRSGREGAIPHGGPCGCNRFTDGAGRSELVCFVEVQEQGFDPDTWTGETETWGRWHY